MYIILVPLILIAIGLIRKHTIWGGCNLVGNDLFSTITIKSYFEKRKKKLKELEVPMFIFLEDLRFMGIYFKYLFFEKLIGTKNIQQEKYKSIPENEKNEVLSIMEKAEPLIKVRDNVNLEKDERIMAELDCMTAANSVFALFKKYGVDDRLFGNISIDYSERVGRLVNIAHLLPINPILTEQPDDETVKGWLVKGFDRAMAKELKEHNKENNLNWNHQDLLKHLLANEELYFDKIIIEDGIYKFDYTFLFSAYDNKSYTAIT
jgi:hypothetical protein